MTGALTRRGLFWTSVALGLSGCASTPPRLESEQVEVWPELEPLLGAVRNRHGVVIRIASHGCVAKADLVFHIDRTGGRTVVAFARRRLETCKGLASEATFLFDYAALGLRPGERFSIVNPILTKSARRG